MQFKLKLVSLLSSLIAQCERLTALSATRGSRTLPGSASVSCEIVCLNQGFLQCATTINMLPPDLTPAPLAPLELNQSHPLHLVSTAPPIVRRAQRLLNASVATVRFPASKAALTNATNSWLNSDSERQLPRLSEEQVTLLVQ